MTESDEEMLYKCAEKQRIMVWNRQRLRHLIIDFQERVSERASERMNASECMSEVSSAEQAID